MEFRGKERLGVAGGLAAAAAAAWWLRGRAARFDGQSVLITGGSRGLGLLLAREFARRGARIAICARDVEELARARRDIEERCGAEAIALRCDVTDRQQVEELVHRVEQRFGGIDILVNNAGIIQVGPERSMSPDDYRASLDINLWGAIHATRAALPGMRARRAGRIVFVTSIGGVMAVPHLVPYCTAKFAEVGFSTGLAAELEQEGIRVTTVVPGLMRTGSFLHALPRGQQEKETAWFTLGASLPLLSMSAERAARHVVEGCARNRRWITLGLPARMARLAVGLAPGAVTAIEARVARLLPGPGAGGAPRKPDRGRAHRSALARSFLTRLGDRAARRYNETPAGPA